MAKSPGVGETHKCCICSKEANDAHGSIHHIFWLCDKHNKEFKTEEKILEKMVEMWALTNIKKRFLSES